MLCPSKARRSIGSGQRQHAAVGRDAEAAVVVQVDRRVAQLPRQRQAVVMAPVLPLQVVHAQAVQQHEQARRRPGRMRAQGLALDPQGLARSTKGHRDRQRIGAGREMVAEDTVEGGDHRLPLRTGRLLRIRREQGR